MSIVFIDSFEHYTGLNQKWSFGNQLSAVQLECDRAYSATENGPNPIGRLPVVFEPEVHCPAGGFLQVDILVL
jgi:hypothetical protein